MKKDYKCKACGKNNKTPIYTIGSADPYTFVQARCCCESPQGMSSTDVQVFLLDVDNTEKPQSSALSGKQCAFLDGVNLNFTSVAKGVWGSLRFIATDSPGENKKYLSKQHRLIVKYATEYGATDILFDGIVKFSDSLELTASINEISPTIEICFTSVIEDGDYVRAGYMSVSQEE